MELCNLIIRTEQVVKQDVNCENVNAIYKKSGFSLPSAEWTEQTAVFWCHTHSHVVEQPLWQRKHHQALVTLTDFQKCNHLFTTLFLYSRSQIFCWTRLKSHISFWLKIVNKCLSTIHQTLLPRVFELHMEAAGDYFNVVLHQNLWNSFIFWNSIHPPHD